MLDARVPEEYLANGEIWLTRKERAGPSCSVVVQLDDVQGNELTW